mgnify:CR=1 FL=1
MGEYWQEKGDTVCCSFPRHWKKIWRRSTLGLALRRIFYAKRIELYHCPGAIVLFDNMASLESLWSLLLDAATRHTPSLEPERMPHTGTQVYDLLMNHSGLPAEDGPVKGMDDLIRRMTAGMAVLLLEGCKKGLVFSVQGLKSRSVEEPSGEGNLRGSREGFADLLRVNLSLLRRLIRTAPS